MADIKVSKNFIEGIVVECYNQGLSKEAASMVLEAVIAKESGMVKEAGWGAVFRELGPALWGTARGLGRGLWKAKKPLFHTAKWGVLGTGFYQLGKHLEAPAPTGGELLPAGMSAKEYATMQSDAYNTGIANANDRKTDILERIQDAKLYGSPGEVEALQKQLKAIEGDVSGRQGAIGNNIKQYEKSYNYLNKKITALEGNKDAWWRKWVPFTDNPTEARKRLADYKQKLRATRGHLGSLRNRNGFINSGATVYTPRSLNAHPSSNDYISNDFQRYVE